MLKDIIKKDYIKFTDLKLNWKDAIKLSAKALVEDDVIKQGYVDNMIKNVEDHGPYIDLGKGIAIAHAKNRENINKTGISILKLSVPTYLSDQEDHKIDMLITLASKDDDEHLDYLSKLTTILSDEKTLREFKEASTVEHLYNIIHKTGAGVRFGTVCGESLVSSFMIKQNISNTLNTWGIRDRVEIYCFDLDNYKEQKDIDVWFVTTELKDKLDVENPIVIDSIIDRVELEEKLKLACEKYDLL